MPRHIAPFLMSGFALLTTGLPAWGQNDATSVPLPPQVLTVEEAVRLAVSRNPRLEAAVRDIQAASSGVRSSRALVNPTVLFAPGITSISGTGEEFLAQQPLEINGTRRARTAVATADLRGARAGSLVVLRDTIFDTRTSYFALARAERRAQITRELLSITQEADRIARRQVEEGARAGIDLAQTGIEVSRAEREVTLSDSAVREARAGLNTLLARDPNQPVSALPLTGSEATDGSTGSNNTPVASVPGDAPVGQASTQALPLPLPRSNPGAPPTLPPGTPQANAGSGESLVSQAFIIRGETQSAVALRDRFLAEAALARAEGRPDIAPQVRVGYFTRGLQPASDGNGAGVGLAVTLPLFDYGSRKNRVRQAEESARAQESRITAAQNDIRQEIVRSQARLAASEAILANYRGGVLERAKRLLEASQLGLREGRVSIVALLEAQRSYIGIQNEYADALAEVATARAALERASGIIPDTLSAIPAP